MWKSLGRSLILRLVGVSLLLLLVVQLAGFAVVRASIERNARGQIARELDVDENVWRRLLEQNAERLRQGSALLAADYGFRSAVHSGEEETIQSVLENHGERIGAAVTALLGTDMALRAISAPVPAQALVPTLALLAPQLASSPQGSQVAVVEGVPYQFVMVPMRAPVVIGWVLMGFPLGQPLADEMRQLLSVHVALVVQGTQGPAAVHVSTLPAPLHGPVLAMGADGGELASADGLLLARSSPLPSLNGQVHAVLLRSVDAVVAPYRQLQVLLSIITAGGGVVVCPGQRRDGAARDQPAALADAGHPAPVARRVRHPHGAHRAAG